MTPLPEEKIDEVNLNPCNREKSNCTIFLGYTSNLISSGIRETFRYLAQHNMVSTSTSDSHNWIHETSSVILEDKSNIDFINFSSLWWYKSSDDRLMYENMMYNIIRYTELLY